MNILSLHNGADTGGQGYRIKQAFDRHTDWTFDQVVRRQSYADYPYQHRWNSVQNLELARQADVIHVHNGFSAWRMLRRHFKQDRKGLVVHHHGAVFRINPTGLLKETQMRGAVGIVSTLDLWSIAPEQLEWVPAPFDLAYLARLREHHYRPDHRTLRIAHAPTHRAAKSTDAFIAAMERLARRYPLEMVLIEGKSWQRCLELKATADIFFDQCLLGYGNNAVEAWSMGIPVIAGVDHALGERLGQRYANCKVPPGTLDAMHSTWGELPFYSATEDTLGQALEALIADETLRANYAERGVAHTRRWHAEASVVALLQRVYIHAAQVAPATPVKVRASVTRMSTEPERLPARYRGIKQTVPA